MLSSLQAFLNRPDSALAVIQVSETLLAGKPEAGLGPEGLPFQASLGERKIRIMPFSPKALRFRLVLLSDFLETHCGKNQVDLLVGGILVQA